jgi:hypothetical protein
VQVPDSESDTELQLLLQSCLQKTGFLQQASMERGVLSFDATDGITELAQTLISRQSEVIDYCASMGAQSRIVQAIADVRKKRVAHRPAALKDSGNRHFRAGDLSSAVDHWRAAVRLQCDRSSSAVPCLPNTRTEVWSQVCSPLFCLALLCNAVL